MMKKSTLTALIIAGALVVAGLIVGFIALAINGFDWNRFGNKIHVTQELEITEDINEVQVTFDSCNLELLPSTDGTCKVVYSGIDDIKPALYVDEDILYLSLEDNRTINSYIDIYFFPNKATIYLPEKTYRALTLVGTSGKVIMENVDASDVYASTSSGEVIMENVDASDLTATATSGDITLNKTASTYLTLKTTSGNIVCDTVSATDMSAYATSGDIVGTITKDTNYDASTTSGEVLLDFVD